MPSSSIKHPQHYPPDWVSAFLFLARELPSLHEVVLTQGITLRNLVTKHNIAGAMVASVKTFPGAWPKEVREMVANRQLRFRKAHDLAGGKLIAYTTAKSLNIEEVLKHASSR